MAEVSIKIVVDDDHLDATESIARTIGEHGLRIDRVVPEAGAIRAFGEESDLDALRKIDGVLEVTRERTYKLPPMNDKIPQ